MSTKYLILLAALPLALSACSKAEDESGDGSGADKLADWYETQLTGNDFKVVRDGTNLSGKTAEDDPFSLVLTESSGDETKGVLEFSEH